MRRRGNRQHRGDGVAGRADLGVTKPASVAQRSAGDDEGIRDGRRELIIEATVVSGALIPTDPVRVRLARLCSTHGRRRCVVPPPAR